MRGFGAAEDFMFRLGQEYGGMIRHDNHAFCDEEELERFYQSQRQSPVLGGEGFIEKVRERIGKVAREHPRMNAQR
jgi:hypothetical protein